jgi:chromosome segregation and condensation protein ScpB
MQVLLPADHPRRAWPVLRQGDQPRCHHLRRLDLIGSGPRAPQPGAPYTYVTTKAFLAQFGFDTLRDLPDMEALEDAALLSKDKLFAE